jgi:malate synthase
MDDRASDIQVVRRADERGEEILTPGALALVEELHRRFGERRDELLRRRRVRREEMSRAATADPSRGAGGAYVGLGHGSGTGRSRRSTSEITGPPEPKMAINALNSGSRAWLADLRMRTPLIGRTSYPARSHLPMRCAGA